MPSSAPLPRSLAAKLLLLKAVLALCVLALLAAVALKPIEQALLPTYRPVHYELREKPSARTLQAIYSPNSTAQFQWDTDVYKDGLSVFYTHESAVTSNESNPLSRMYNNVRSLAWTQHDSGVLKLYRDAVVWNENDATYAKSSSIFLGLARCGNLDESTSSLPPQSRVTVAYPRAVLVSSQLWGENTYHAVSETVFPLALAYHAFLLTHETMIIVDRLIDIALAYFELLGIHERSRIVELSASGKAYLVGQLFLPTGSACGYSPSGTVSAMQQWIRSVHRTLYSSPSTAKDIVVIDRKEDGYCAACFEYLDTLLAALRLAYPHRHVTSIVTGNMHPISIMEVLSRAEVVIAAHGAGLVHMVLLPEGAAVVEVHTRFNSPNECFRGLAGSANLKYVGVDGFNKTDEKAVIANIIEAVQWLGIV